MVSAGSRHYRWPGVSGLDSEGRTYVASIPGRVFRGCKIAKFSELESVQTKKAFSKNNENTVE